MFWNAWCMRKVVGEHAWFQRHMCITLNLTAMLAQLQMAITHSF